MIIDRRISCASRTGGACAGVERLAEFAIRCSSSGSARDFSKKVVSSPSTSGILRVLHNCGDRADPKRSEREQAAGICWLAAGRLPPRSFITIADLLEIGWTEDRIGNATV